MSQSEQIVKPAKDQDLRQFNTLVCKLEGGALNEELTEAMKKAVREISDACLDRGGTHKASITLKLEFKMDQKDKIVEISAEVNEKMPKTPRGRGGLFFTDSEGNLTRENPRQLDLMDELERKRMRDIERAGQTG